jgi:hypothetical protein
VQRTGSQCWSQQQLPRWLPAPWPPASPPTPAQLEWANSGYGAFIHYNTGTYVSDGGGCNVKDLRKDQCQAKLDPNLFAPEKVDTDQWLSLIKAYGGGKYAVLTVKQWARIRLHCGMLPSILSSSSSSPVTPSSSMTLVITKVSAGAGGVRIAHFSAFKAVNVCVS